MKNKHHIHFLQKTKKLDEILDQGGNLYHLAVKISQDLDSRTIYSFCKILHIIQKDGGGKILELCKEVYINLAILVGTEQLQQISEKEANNTKKEVEKTIDKLLEELNDLIGLQSVKDKINDLIAFRKIQEFRKQNHLKLSSNTLHIAFLGNPGTGKTTVARIVGQIYNRLGILSKGHFIEASRTDLIAGYQGQTAIKVKQIIEKAKGGVLFIDEAYSITENEHSDSYGRECLTELTKALEDYRDDLVVIVAGYTEPMNAFFVSNPGLKSRFNSFIEFENYTEDELLEIFVKICDKNDYIIDNEVKQKVQIKIQDALNQNENYFSNARFIRNIFEETVMIQARRLNRNATFDMEDLKRIIADDIKG